MPTRVKVNPGTSSPTHSLSISDGSQTWGLELVDGPRSIQENSITPSTLLVNSQGKRFGDADPSMSHIEQSSFAGGRGQELFTDDETRFYDSQNLWTQVEGSVFPTLQWKYATGYRNQDMNQVGTYYNWRPLIGTYYSMSFAASASYNADIGYLWIKKVGTPGTLTLELRDGATNKPNTVLKTATIAATDVSDTLALIQKFDWSGVQALTSGTQYHVVVYGASTDTGAAHWEVMCGQDVASVYSYTSVNSGTDWATTTDQLYFRITDADVAKRWKFFLYGGKIQAVDIKDTGNSQLFNSTTTAFAEVATTGFATVSDVAVHNDGIYFAQGESTNIRRWDGATTFADDGTNKASFLYPFYDKTTGVVLWRANTSATTANISRAPGVAFGNHTFATAINVGDGSQPITGLVDYNNNLWVMKQDSIWEILSDIPYKLNVGMDDAPSSANGAAAAGHGLFLFFSFLQSLERLYTTTLDDVGPGRGAGLPYGRGGVVSALESVISTLFVAIDAGTSGTSSVLAFDGINYHEVFRASMAGKRIRAIKWQPGTLTARPKLWIDCGGDIVYMTFPLNTMNPLRDSGIYYSPEGVLTMSSYDMGASRLPKLFKDLTLITQNLDGVCKIAMDYQVDNDIGSTDVSTWVGLGNFLLSPSDVLHIDEGKKFAIRPRLVLQTNNALLPPVIKASVLEGIARTPVKYQWVLRVKTSSIQATFTGAPDHNPDRLLNWLKEKAGNAEVLHMHSSLKAMDGKVVFAEPPSVQREYNNPILKYWGGQLTIVLREA